MKYEEARAIVRNPFSYDKEKQIEAAKVITSNIFAQEEDLDLAYQLSEKSHGTLKKIFQRLRF